MPTFSNRTDSIEQRFMRSHEEEAARHEAQPWLNKRGGGETFLYFVQAENGGPIKIGLALDPEKRLAQLQTGHPERLVLCEVVWVTRSFERRLHTLFAAYRLHGEWFRAHPVLAHIAHAEPDPALADEPFEYPRTSALDVGDLLSDRFSRVLGPRGPVEKGLRP